MTHTSLAKSFYIAYGWAEGPWLGKRLIASLQTAGFTQSTEPNAAILIGHSSGCYMLRKSTPQQAVIFVGLPYWPGKSMSRALAQKVWHDAYAHQYGLTHWLQKTFWNALYIITRMSGAIRMWRRIRALQVPPAALIIRNTEDTFCIPEIGKYVPNQIIELPGQHDDCWLNPAPYVKLIEDRYAKLLAQTNN